MKKIILSLLFAFSLAIPQQVNAVSYRGFFEAGPGFIPDKFQNNEGRGFNLPFSTTHGIQIINQLYVGIGAGVNLCFENNSYDLEGFSYNQGAFKSIRLYGDIRWDGFGLFGKSKRISPFVDLKFGWQTNGFGLSGHNTNWFNDNDKSYQQYTLFEGVKHYSANGFFLQPQIGVRIGLSSKVGINIGLYIDAVNFLRIGTKQVETYYSVYDYNTGNYSEWIERSEVNLGNLSVNPFGLMLGVDF